MTPNFLQKIITAHYIWLESNRKSGQKADLWNADLRNIDLKGVNLRDAYLRYASLRNVNLAGADLSGANLTSAELRGANLGGADLSNADLYETDLSFANLSFANLTGTNLHGTNLWNVNLSNANLRNVNLSNTNLQNVNLSNANLRNVNLRWANLRDVNLAGAKGLLDPTNWMDSNFQKNNKGYIVFKKLGKGKTEFPPPDHWIIKEGSYLTEIVNEDRRENCSYGINFGTRDWCESHYALANLWKCLLEFGDLEKLIVPYGSDGKARCGRLKLTKKIK